MEYMKFDAMTRMKLTEIIVEAKESDETVEAVDKIEEFMLTPADKRCRHCLNQVQKVINDVSNIPEA